MPRRREVPKREILPDPKYGNVELAKFMNVIMQGGKKAVAERIVYGALEQIEKKNPGKDPVEAFTMAINNVKPMVEVKSRRRGGADSQVPGGPSKCARSAAWPCPCAGSRKPPRSAARSPWPCAWPTNSWKPRKAVAAP